MKENKGSLLGGTLLIGGSCIGAGLLALPILTGLAGFFPSIAMFVAAWAFMTTTGLLMVEVNGWFATQVNIISMAAKSLGRIGKGAGWALYLFLFYSLLVAYISAIGALCNNYAKAYFSIYLPSWIGALFFAALVGITVYQGTRRVDYWNRLLVFGKIAAFCVMTLIGFAYIEPVKLLYMEPAYVWFSLPVLIISFGYHNMIPTVTAYMKGDLHRVRLAILSGSLLALIIYLIWEFVVLSILPVHGEWGLFTSWQMGRQVSDSITGLVGVSWISSAAELLAVFALLSAFLAQTLALVHFLADGFGIKDAKQENPLLCVVALAPPLLCALAYPQLFIKALSFAGGVCTVILFGFFPAIMAWKGRYHKEIRAEYRVFGGKPLLVLIMLFAMFILFFQLSTMFNASYIAKPV